MFQIAAVSVDGNQQMDSRGGNQQTAKSQPQQGEQSHRRQRGQKNRCHILHLAPVYAGAGKRVTNVP